MVNNIRKQLKTVRISQIMKLFLFKIKREILIKIYKMLKIIKLKIVKCLSMATIKMLYNRYNKYKLRLFIYLFYFLLDNNTLILIFIELVWKRRF